MVKEPLVIDLIEGKLHGGLKDIDEARDGAYPEVKPLATSMLKAVFPFLSTRERTDVALHPERNIKTVRPPYGPEITFLIPTEDIEGVNIERTVWHQLMGQQHQESKELIEENKRLRKRIGELEKEVDRLEESEEEKKKRDAGPSKVKCRMCSDSYAPRTWREQKGRCPGCDSLDTRFTDGNPQRGGSRSGAGGGSK